MKKFLGLLLGMVAAAAIIAATPADVKAEGMPCTEATLQQFQNNLAIAKQELAQAEALKAQADAAVEALKAQGVTGLELQQATDAAFNAGNVVNAYKSKVANCEVSVSAITGRGAVEQYYLDLKAKWADRATLDSTKVQLDGANQITAAAFEQLNTLKTALTNQMANAASNPALQSNVTAMQAQVAAAEQDYLAKKATSDALAVKYAQQLGTLNYATNADNDAWGAFVKNYGAGLAKQYKLYGPDGKEYPVFTYYSEDPYILVKPDEWAIRWFE